MVVMILGSGFEPVEAIAPCDILRRGGVEVQLAGIGGRMVEAGHGVTVQADCTIEEADFDRAEMVVLPGGLGGVRSILGCKAAIDAVGQAYDDGKFVAAICAGPTILAQLHITDGMKDGGLLILNGDDPLLKGVQGREGLRTVYYGTGENCDFRAVDICFEDGFPSFTAVHGADRQRVRLNVMGQHNVMNAMAAMAVCAECGMTMEEAARGLLTGQGFKNRQQVHETGRFTILDDSYNACPESMKAAFQVFKELHPERRHVAVLAEMRELGRETESAHRQVGVFAAEAGIHLLVTLGAECRALTEEFKKRSGAPVAEFTDKDQMTAYLDQALQDGDCVLFKGANSMALFKVAARYMENRPE